MARMRSGARCFHNHLVLSYRPKLFFDIRALTMMIFVLLLLRQYRRPGQSSVSSRTRTLGAMTATACRMISGMSKGNQAMVRAIFWETRSGVSPDARISLPWLVVVVTSTLRGALGLKFNSRVTAR